MRTDASLETAPSRIAVIGAGRAGAWFTRRCLSAGLSVILEDVLPEKLRRAADVSSSLPESARTSLRLVTSVEDAVRSVDLAIDFVPDELESKLEILSLLDRMAPPHTIFLTPTDALSIADLASCTYRPARCFAAQGIAAAEAGALELALRYPAQADPTALQQAVHLLERLGFRVNTAVDQEPTQLTARPARMAD